jgi:hypothetical protein
LKTIDPSATLLVQILNEAYVSKAWHGPNLKGSLRRLRAADAQWRPGPGRHNIWEIAVHAAYWKYAVRRRILGERRGSFALKGSNWFVCPEPGLGVAQLDEAWRRDRILLDDEHRKLIEPVRDGHGTADRRRLYGVALHDVYHAGQIQLLSACLMTSEVPQPGELSSARPRLDGIKQPSVAKDH